ncbi:MAG TPA: hypothetical protein DCS93_28750 [Microscillaceae bacterium]|nr:hypothetical protein [Microscillaceae bacterium]
MQRNFLKEYIEASNEFRKSGNSQESIEKLYDLLYALETIEKTIQEAVTLSNIYSLLGFHQSAYEVFKTTVDSSNRKTLTKLHVLEEKAKSHQNNFVIKDLRKYRQKKVQVSLLPTDFIPLETGKHTYTIAGKDVIIFNKVVKSNKVEVYLPNQQIEPYLDKVIRYITWLSDCKNELIAFYNDWNKGETTDIADGDWYDSLDVYRVKITVGKNENLYADIAAGDVFAQDHLLDIETDQETIYSMNHDG